MLKLGSLITAIQIDENGFYSSDQTDVQIIVDITSKQITTISMKKDNPLSEIIYEQNTSIPTDTGYVNKETMTTIVDDQNNSFDLTLKALKGKIELLSYTNLAAMVVDTYTTLATKRQHTPNETKAFDQLHELNKLKFESKIVPKQTTPTATKDLKTKAEL